MTGPPTSEIASEVDRLVIAVHRAVMSRHRSQLQHIVESIGVTSPGHLYDLAEFLAAGAGTAEISRRRFSYDPNGVGPALSSELLDRQLVDDRLNPSEPLAAVTTTILQWRAEAATNLWGSDPATAQPRAVQALSRASGPLVEAFRSLPYPTQPAHRLHHLLTGLRYARFDAHIAAWESAGLSAIEIVALSSAVASGPGLPVPESLVARGLLTVDGSATAKGQAARAAIEAETNARCDLLFGPGPDRRDWLASLRSLPPQDR